MISKFSELFIPIVKKVSALVSEIPKVYLVLESPAKFSQNEIEPVVLLENNETSDAQDRDWETVQKT